MASNAVMGLHVEATDRHDFGFSVAEIIVVLAIVGTLATMSLPSLLTYWHTATVRAAARELVTVMNLGRQLAISRKTSVCVDLSGTSLRLRLGSCTGPFWTGPVTDGAGQIRLSDPALFHVSSNAQVVFTPLGAAAPSATYTIRHLRTDASRAVVIAATGRISVE